MPVHVVHEGHENHQLLQVDKDNQAYEDDSDRTLVQPSYGSELADNLDSCNDDQDEDDVDMERLHYEEPSGDIVRI